MPRRQTAEKAEQAPRPSQLAIEPMPPHEVGRWNCNQTRVEAVEQLLFGSVRTGRPVLVCSALEADTKAVLEAQAKAQELLGDGKAEAALALPFAPDLPYRIVRRMRQGWEACPPELAAHLAASLPRWLAPRAPGDLLASLPASTAAQTHAVAAFLLPRSDAGRAQDDASAAAHYFYLVGGGGQEESVEWLLVAPEHKRAAAQLWRGGEGTARGGGGAASSSARAEAEVHWPSEASAHKGWPFPVHCARQRLGALAPRASALQPRVSRLQSRVVQAAAPCTPGCSPVWSRLQHHVVQVAAPCYPRRAAPHTTGLASASPHLLRLPGLLSLLRGRRGNRGDRGTPAALAAPHAAGRSRSRSRSRHHCRHRRHRDIPTSRPRRAGSHGRRCG